VSGSSTARMLPARYSLHDVDDVEQFAVVVLELESK
jgi:hypothetical protein